MKKILLSITFLLIFSCLSKNYRLSDFKYPAYPLFDGTQETIRSGWEKSSGYKIVKGELTGNGRLYTKKTYKDFMLYFEFKFTKKKANSGLGIRTRDKGDPAYSAFELQILENSGYGDRLRKYQYHGSVYGVVPAKRGFLKPLGQWNKQIVILKRHRIKVILNDKVIVNTDLRRHKPLSSPKGRKYAKGLLNKTGKIMIAGHGGGVNFKNIYIRELR